MTTFVEAHSAAQAVVVATIAGGFLTEIVATVVGRRRGEGGWPRGAIIEALTGRRIGDRESGAGDRGTLQVLVASTVAGIVAGWFATRHVPGATIASDGWIPLALGAVVAWLGFGLRAWGILTLGRFFRRVVAVEPGHEVVRTGPYRAIRHPAYAGDLLFTIGLGLMFDNWLAVAALTVLPLLGHLPRIRVEERELERQLGDAYLEYERESRRLIPGVW